MNKIILCEGETDAILLSYYLGKVSGWNFCRKPPVNIAIKTDSFAEDPYDAVIVEKAGSFVKEMRSVASKYIDSNRKELKAHLGVTWAVQYPEKVFKLMNEQIQSVKWEESAILHKCFEQLEKIQFFYLS